MRNTLSAPFFALTAALALPAHAQLAPATAPASAPPSVAAPAAPASTAADQRLSALMARVHLKVVHPEQVRQTLTDAAIKLGGHATRITDQGVVLKVPPPELGEFLRKMGDHGLVLEKTLSRQDMTEAIADLEGRLRSKQEIFGQLRAFFDRSNLQATLDIERNMTQLVDEMESIKGQLRVERDRTRWAQVQVDFQFQSRDRVVYVDSPFEWLNTVDLDRFLSEFDGEE
jgi:hypothetical protein